MPPRCEKSRICRLLPDLAWYQPRGGKHHAEAARSTSPQASHVKPPDQELTAAPSLYPFRGSFKRIRQILESRDLVWSLAWAAHAVAGRSRGRSLPPRGGCSHCRDGRCCLRWRSSRASPSGRASALSVTEERTLEISVAFLPFVVTAVAFGPLAAFIVGALANLGDFRRPYMRWAVYTPMRALTGAAAGFAAAAVVTTSNPESFGAILLATLLAAVANLACDAILNFGTLLVRRPTSPLMYVRAMIPHFFVAVPLYVPVAALLVYGYEKYSLVAIGAFLLPVVALQRVIHLYQEQREVSTELADLNAKLERANLSFASALVATLDARDRYTAGHSAAVAIYSRDIAERLGLDEETAAAVLSHRTGPRHRENRAAARPPGEARCANARRATPDAGALRYR